MLYLYIFCLTVFFFCSGCENEKSNSVQHSNSNESFTDTVGVKIIDTIPIEVSLKVTPFSMDSIMAYVTFFNKGNKSMWIYSPILRDTPLSVNSFVILDKKNSKLPFIGQVNKHNNSFRSLDSLPLVIPDLSTKNLIEFGLQDSIQAKFNLSRTYDFKILKGRHEKYFRIEYTCFFPYIEDGRHIFRDNNALKVIQPVYFIVSTIRKEPESFRLKIELPTN